MDEKVYVEFAEDCGNYDNVIYNLRIKKCDLPHIGDTIEFYPEINGRKVVDRKITYSKGEIDKIRIYL